MIFKDMCRIGSGGKQYPLCNRRKKKKKAALSLFSLCLSFFLFLPLVLCVYFLFAVSLSSTTACTFSYDLLPSYECCDAVCFMEC